MSDKAEKKKSKKTRQSDKPARCTHEYAYCYYNSKENENVYRCVHCGKFSYQ